MRIFELHFNPYQKARPSSVRFGKNEMPESVFDCFRYEPGNVYEKRMGSLYMVGELSNVMPQGVRLLDSLAGVIKGKHYAFPMKTPEQSLRESLKKANEFLSGEVKKDNVNWLGNLNFAVLAIKNLNLNFTKVGAIKILLLRSGVVTDISKNLEFAEIEPYPLKVFTSIVSGNLAVNDRLMVLTKKVFEFFNETAKPQRFSPTKIRNPEKPIPTIIQEIALSPVFNEKRLGEILKNKEKALSEVSGICFLIDLSEELSGEPEIFTFQKETEKFSLAMAVLPIIKTFWKIGLAMKNIFHFISSRFKEIAHFIKTNLSQSPLPAVKLSFPKPAIGSSVSFGSILGRLKQISPPFMKEGWEKTRKKLLLVVILIFLLFIGSLVFKQEEARELKKKRSILDEARLELSQAENFLAFKDEGKANVSLKRAWDKVLPLTKESPFEDEALTLKDIIEEKLELINRLEKIEEPELILEFDQKDFIPQKMVFSGGSLYFFSPISKSLFKIDPFSKEKNSYSLSLLEISGFNLAADLGDAIAFFLRPNKIVIFKNGEFTSAITLKEPYPDFNFTSFSVFKSSLYFFEEKNSKIIKYPYLKGNSWGLPEIWLKNESLHQTRSGAGSLTVDGIVWVLNQDNTISRYRAGKYQDDIIFDFFPYPKKLYKIFVLADLPYLYLLEPVQKRIVILEKSSNKVVKQFQSEAFDNLKDFSVSGDGKTIYLLNGLKIYRLSI